MYIPKKTISSMVTNFKENGELDLHGLLENLEFQKKVGIESVCVLGGTGEASSLSREERHLIMETIMKNSDELKVVFGALVGTPEDVKVDIIKAKELGADAVMVMPTPFVRPSERDVEKFMEELTKLGVPLILFNTPSRSGFNMSASLINRLSEIEGIVGIKEASGDLILLQEVIQYCKKTFGVLTGGDNLYLPSLALGAVGGILASAAVVPEINVALDNAILKGDIEKSKKLHYLIKLLDEVMYKASHPVPLKLAMDIRGLPAGKCRSPFSDLDSEHEKEVFSVMKEIKENLQGIVEFSSKYPL